MSVRGRDIGVDAVRGLALLAMYVAHTTSRTDPGPVTLVANLLTAALFATLVGVGAGLAGGRRGLREDVVAPLVRGAALVVLGLLLNRAGSSVIVILVHLGLLTWLVALLARRPTWLVALVGATMLAVSPVLLESLAAEDARLSLNGPHWQSLLLDLTATGDTYRLTSLLGWAALGLVLARTLVAAPGWTRQVLAGLGTLAAGVIAVLVGRPVPYSGTHVELVTDALLASGVLLLGVALARVVLGRGLGWLAGMGRMTLSLYTLQVLGIAVLEQWLRPDQPPYGWDVLASLVTGSLLLTLAWNGFAPARRWGRGPLEGAVEHLVDLIGGRPATRDTSRSTRGRTAP